MIKPKVKKGVSYYKANSEQAPRKTFIVEWSGFAYKEQGQNEKELNSVK